jgi:hypothetical protein
MESKKAAEVLISLLRKYNFEKKRERSDKGRYWCSELDAIGREPAEKIGRKAQEEIRIILLFVVTPFG